MLDYQSMYNDLEASPFAAWNPQLPKIIENKLHKHVNSDLPVWVSALQNLPELQANTLNFNSDVIQIGSPEQCGHTQRRLIESQLQTMHPWRKGPYNLFGIDIDTEWRSDLKWQRLLPALDSLQGRYVLDVGCGSGYHCWRMFGSGCKLVLGIEPMLRYNLQFLALKHFVGAPPVHLLPVAFDELPASITAFDSVFSMGILYHRKSPIDHLLNLKTRLRPGGQLILETLILDSKQQEILVPRARYAKMPNVWFIPSCSMLELWLKRTGFTNIKVVNISRTTLDEQRSTRWMRFESLVDFIDPNNPSKTVEGYQAPMRAILSAHRPD